MKRPKGQKPITVEIGVRSRETAWLDTTPAQAHRLLEAINSLKLWDHERRCWKFPQRRVDDLLLEATGRHLSVYVVEVER